MSLNLFDDVEAIQPWQEPLDEGAVVLRQFATTDAKIVLAEVQAIETVAPFRHLVTPGGFRMSVAMTNCGAVGWVSDRSGYRYDPIDPASGKAWPAMPDLFQKLARDAAAAAGFSRFAPNACLINRYAPGTRLTLHQDKDELDFTQPIVSVSLGIPAVFLFGGLERGQRAHRIPVTHGDVVVWGGPARLRYHGVAPIKPGRHSLVGDVRINLTFRQTG